MLTQRATSRYRETQPGQGVPQLLVRLDGQNDSTLRCLLQAGQLRPSVNVTWANYWTSSVSVTRNLPTKSVSLTRGGPLMAGPGLEHDRQRRQPGDVADAMVRHASR